MRKLHISYFFIALTLSLCGTAQSQDSAIIPAPAFTAEQLNRAPTDGWLTNGGSLSNQRYSPLTQINKNNVINLKAEWRASLNGSGMKNRRAGNQAQPLVHEGTLYIATGDNDVFAINIETGEIVWEYTPDLRDDARACCGWAVRGVGLGDGKVFFGQIDSKLVALDQQTGEVIWEVQTELPAEGYAIASAPLYYNGMIITGFAGGDLGIRGHLNAYDANDGSLIWTFYTVPGPGEFGHDTWPQDNDVWKYGGASIWQTPAIDPELGLIYFSTGNPGPVLNGHLREGDNLFSSSIVAVDVNTGEYRWHFQEVHHDIWDYDAPNPVILFDAEYEGVMRKGIAQAGKTGWVYIVDRITGEPLIGMVETPVMQEPQQKTSPTQPFPIGDALVPQSLDMPPEGFKLVNEGKIFTPFTDEVVIWKPLAAVNWPPSSFSPRTGLMYVCATDSTWGGIGGDPGYPVEPGALYSGSAIQFVAAPRRGVFAAMDVTTNTIAWNQQWVDTCYGGSMVTGSDLLFIGRNDGRLTALDATNGDKLWEFQTDGGITATASSFMYKGTQYIAVLAGGTSLAPSKKFDGVWLFSLNGTTESLPDSAGDPNARAGVTVLEIPDRKPNLASGKSLFSQTCFVCHGDDGQGGHGGAALTASLDVQTIMNVVTNGKGDMPSFEKSYTVDQLHDVGSYIMEVLVPATQ